LSPNALSIRSAHSSLFRTTSKNDVVGALFLLVLLMMLLFIVLLRLEIPVCRGLAGLDHAKAGLVRVS